jgi:hypothetical protein
VSRQRQFPVSVVLCGAVAAGLCVFGSSGIENARSGDHATPRATARSIAGAGEQASTAAPAGSDLGSSEAATALSLGAPAGAPIGKLVRADPEPPETARVSAAAAPASEASSPASAPPPPETRFKLASVSSSDPLKEDPKAAVRPDETPGECAADEACIDQYLWSLYERAPKVDVNKVTEQKKETVTKDGKTRTITKTITNFVLGDFTWKDPAAAQRANMSLKDYVIGGLDPGFKLTLYRALRAMDDAGLMPGITSAFRDDYRQSIASGNVAASDRSYHGGSLRGGYGHALAADIVSVKGENRTQRAASSEVLWKWIDAHEKELGIGRPYLDKDPPHVGPIDGKEYADKRGRTAVQKAGLRTNNTQEAGLDTKKRRVKIVSTPGRVPRAEQ